jgi:hypothetical protein
MDKDVFWVGEVAAAVHNLHLMYTVDVVDSEVAEGRYRSRAISSAMVQLNDQSERSQGGRVEHPMFEHLQNHEHRKGQVKRIAPRSDEAVCTGARLEYTSERIARQCSHDTSICIHLHHRYRSSDLRCKIPTL